MKKSITNSFISSIISVIIVFSFPAMTLANSGPVFWQGYPSLDVMVIQDNSPIKVEKEDLVFDFSENIMDNYTLGGNVTAAYHMVNPTDLGHSVQMAFPLVGTLSTLIHDDIRITADNKTLSYEVYIGKVVDGHGNPWQTTEEGSFDFADIIKTITHEPYKGENFSANDNGKLYMINVKPTTDQGINFAVDFNFDDTATKVLTKGFNRYERNNTETKIAAWCYKPEILEIYVIGKDIDFQVKAYTDGELKQETDLFNYEISTQELQLKPYLSNYTQDTNINLNDRISDIQLYNLYAQTLDDIFQHMGYASEDYLLSQEHYQRIITLVYTVEFPAKTEREVGVSYKTSGTFDQTQTPSPLYSFDYLLNPAQNWSSFRNLSIKIIPPLEAPYIVKSSIELQRGDDNIYRATLEELPDVDLSFTLYAKETITLLDKFQGSLYKSFGYLTPLILSALLFLAIVLGIKIVFNKWNNNINIK